MNYKAALQHSSEYAGKKKDHYHNPDGSFSFTKSQAEKRKKPKMTKKLESVEKKAAPQMKYSAATQMGHSPAEMGHSPMENQNKGYAKQERKDLMQDMPIVKDAMGGRSWMSKHSNSALRMGHSPAEMGHESPAKHVGSAHGAKHKEEVGHKNQGIHSHASGSQKKKDDAMKSAEKRKKVKATVKAGKALAKSM